MKATYQDWDGGIVECLLLGHNLKGTMALIELEGEEGWCSAHLVEEY